MKLRSTGIRLGLAVAAAALAPVAAARADMLHAIYRVSLVGLPIGSANLDAALSPSSYAIRADAKLTGLARLFANARGASTGAGAIVAGRVSPSTFATTAASSQMTRTIRMALAGNAVTGVDIAPPFDDKPDRVPLGAHDEQNIVDPVGAVVIPAPASGAMQPTEACNRKIPIFDGYTRFDIDLTYVGERSAKAKGYDGPVVVCAARYVPISGHSPDRPATKFMAENKDVEVWLAPIEADRVWMPFRISVRTMIGTTVVEAQEFRVKAE
ncbi:uncharacterized protein DUF3108 [Roseiarcus fermentans]|uniref:Uncharacterized protein DUF3108 n=2 Tax=Roseiarcus fermentans TaxID=1473586 RepID=A0A366EP71_9HYPH|nr:uncharacterized protein DUF3108 [Roseiarcus fermentans]